MSIKPLSREYLINRGSCCKNNCKNCPYKEKNNMKEKEKYFTPDTEDIRLGYEAEIAYLHEDNWTPTKWRHEEEVLATISNLLNYNRRIRTPYLTKEQIEAEGLEYVKSYESDWDSHRDVFKSRIYYITYDFEYKKLFVNQNDHFGISLYTGECKDINTFRYICKLLNIK